MGGLLLKHVTFLSGHYFQSKRKAGFHWLAEAFLSLGYHVTFVTCPISWLSWLKKDHRFDYPVLEEKGNVVNVKENLESYLFFTTVHPINCRNKILNMISGPLFSLYGREIPPKMQELIVRSDLIIFESNQSLLLFETINRINESARKIYRVSDDVRKLRFHPIVPHTETQIIQNFDLVSLPSKSIYPRFSNLKNVKIHNHGIQKGSFEKTTPNPYLSNTINLVFVGSSHFDFKFLEIASSLFPDYLFHVIGPIPEKVRKRNVRFYGEMAFQETIPLIKYAQIGLQTRTDDGLIAQTLTDSLKVLQYSYCRLPIIAPITMKNDWRKNMFFYEPSDAETIRKAIFSATLFDKKSFDNSDINNWEEVASSIIKDLNSNFSLPLSEVSN